MIRVLHVVATTQRRGAEIFASQLIGALTGDDARHAVAVLRSEGPRPISFPAPTVVLGDGRPMGPWARGKRLRAAARSFGPTVVQAHGGEALKVAVASRLGTPIVYRRIGDAPRWLLHGPRRWMWTALMHRATIVVTVAESLRRESVSLFHLPPGRVRTIPNGVDPDAVSPRRPRDDVRRELGVGSQDALLVSVGALAPEKDPIGTLDLVEPVLREHRDARLVFVGEGPMRPALQERIRVRSLTGAVRLLGARDDVGDLLVAADLMVFGSPANAMEGMPATLIEAGLCGLPVVGYASAGASEVIRDGVTGFLARPGDREMVRDRLSRSLGDPRLRRRMGLAARERCRAFQMDRIAPRYRELYREVVGAA